MTETQQYTVPRLVLTAMLRGVVLDTAQLILSSWHSPEVVHPGDDFGRVFLWLWREDQDEAVKLFADVMWNVRRQQPNATKQITLDGLMNGLRLATQGVQPGELATLRDKMLERARFDHAEDPNSTS